MSRRKKRIFVDTSQLHKKKTTKAQQALNLAKSNRKKIREGQDLKVNTSAPITATLNATPAVLFMSADSADGVKAKVKSIRVSGYVLQNLTSTITDDYRIDLVMDRYPDKAVITPLLYLGTATPKIAEFKNFLGKERYKIIKTWSGHFNESTTVSRKISGYFRQNVTQVSVTNNSMGQTDIIRNAYYLVYWTTASANQPTMYLNWRLVYSDAEG